MLKLTPSIPLTLLVGVSDAAAQGTPPPPPVWPMPAGLPPHTGWFLALLVCAVALGIAWFFLGHDRPPPPPCA